MEGLTPLEFSVALRDSLASYLPFVSEMCGGERT